MEIFSSSLRYGYGEEKEQLEQSLTILSRMDIPSAMPLHGREEDESEFHPRHVARMGNEGRTDPGDDSVGGEKR